MSVARITQLIKKKSQREALSEEEIAFFVKQVSSCRNGGTVDEMAHFSQTGAMLMAMYLNGLNADETRALMLCMKKSGYVFSWPPEWRHLVVDKHSTGGVGDKVSLVLAPALAALGLKVPMISGRSLAHTGGTLDKLESIPGYGTEQGVQKIQQMVEQVGCCIVEQTADIVPADRLLYRCRDLTSTVTNTSLITASIVSKKLAEGLSALVYDVKFGRGSFFKSMEEAQEMTKSLILASSTEVRSSALFTAMDVPIGNQIGNSLEVLESVECLQGKGPADLLELVEELGGELMYQTGQCSSLDSAKLMISSVLTNGSALNKFYDMILQQGVSKETAQTLCYEDPMAALPQCKTITDIVYEGNGGYVNDIDAMALAEIWRQEKNRTSTKCLATGFTIKKHVGDQIQSGDVWLQMHHNASMLDDHVVQTLKHAITVGAEETGTRKRVHKVVRYTDGEIVVVDR